MEFQLLGPFAVRAGGRTVTVGSPKHRVMLAMLLLQAGRIVPIGALAEAVWGDELPGNPRRAVQLHIARLRKVLTRAAAGKIAGEFIVTEVDGYRIDVRPEQVDLGRFQAWLRCADEAARRGDLHDEANALSEALGQWRDDPLAGLPSDLLQREVAPRLAEQRLDVVERRLEVELRQGRYAETAGELLALTAQHPLRERLWALLMRALDGNGRRADALQAYHTVRIHLAQELGIDPSDELQRLHTTILIGRSQPTLLPPVPRQLPLAAPSFTGRTRELSRLDGLVAGHPAATVVALITGTAGIGKTTLAVHWAHQATDRFPDGQLWASLHGSKPAGAVPPGEVLRRFLRFLGVPDAELPFDLDDQIGLYRSLLDGRRMLIVLDNAASSQQVRPLLPGAPGSLVLITSRHRLSDLVAAEGAHPIQLKPLTQSQARRLLTARLGPDRTAADPAAVDEIVSRCAGLPAALTTVAARAATHPELALRAIAAELPNRRFGPHRRPVLTAVINA